MMIVTYAAVAEAHQKDLAVEKKYGVNFIDYWVDEQQGVVNRATDIFLRKDKTGRITYIWLCQLLIH